jgi:hypothetical protein
MILLAFEGLDSEEIAERVGCERHAVGIWRRRWADAFDRLVVVECCERESILIQTIEQLLEAHPRLTREGVLAAVRFGAEVLRADVAYPVSKSVA